MASPPSCRRPCCSDARAPNASPLKAEPYAQRGFRAVYAASAWAATLWPGAGNASTLWRNTLAAPVNAPTTRFWPHAVIAIHIFFAGAQAARPACSFFFVGSNSQLSWGHTPIHTFWQSAGNRSRPAQSLFHGLRFCSCDGGASERRADRLLTESTHWQFCSCGHTSYPHLSTFPIHTVIWGSVNVGIVW